ncbi:MAG: cytochrome C oxidase subunit IV family protein [Flavobacteriales bacterium]|nr:cytochrome C oxidase subunit IV family protein [Flavobacteriales bacterium]
MLRDDIIEYSLDAHHSEEAGRKIRKNIWLVTLLLAVITTVEVALGAYWKEWFPESWGLVKLGYIVLTLEKAGFIVGVFMHLGDERRNVRMIILLPYLLFILYLLFIAIWESNYVHRMLELFQ